MPPPVHLVHPPTEAVPQFPPDGLVVNWRPDRSWNWRAYPNYEAAKQGISVFGDAGNPVLYLSAFAHDRMVYAAQKEAAIAAIASELRWALREMRAAAHRAQQDADRAHAEVGWCERAITEALLEGDRQSARENLHRIQQQRRSAYARARKVADRVLDVVRWLAR